jgi:E3 ubiquitin-protein ligase HUWE1
MLLFRRAEATHKVQAVPTANTLAQMMKDYLEVLPKTEGMSRSTLKPSCLTCFAEQDYLLSVYSSSMTSIVHAFLFDGKRFSLHPRRAADPYAERTTQGSLQTMLLVAFHKAGGMQLLNRLVLDYAQELETLSAEAEDAAKPGSTEDPKIGAKRRFKAFHCHQRFQTIMHLIKSLIANKSVLESSQTVMMTTKDKDPTDPDYFMPQELLISLRLSVFDSIETVWKSGRPFRPY